MEGNKPSHEDHKARSDFVREFVQRCRKHDVAPTEFSKSPPKTIIQFWHDHSRLPSDVRECIKSWMNLEQHGFEIHLFDHGSARNFIARRFGLRYKQAYDRCYHPAMQSDYFRLCYILLEGGCYIDVDDVYHGLAIEHLFRDGRMKVQPLCYDISTNEMVPPSVFTQSGAYSSSWIFYFNNNPLIATNGHPVVEKALTRATESLERSARNELPEIQSTTGPGNLTKSLFEFSKEHSDIEGAMLVLYDWDDIATSKWPLSYRRDTRNWRFSNQRNFQD